MSDQRSIPPEKFGRKSARFPGRPPNLCCTVERFKAGSWAGTGGGILDNFVATTFGQQITRHCGERFLRYLPPCTRLVLMFGMGSRLNCVSECLHGSEASVRRGDW